jgi:TolB protein
LKRIARPLAAIIALALLSACPQKHPGDDSPYMGKILFSSDRDGNYEIYLMNPDGTGLVNLTKNPGADYTPRWSQDRSQIVFVSERDGDPEIYVMNPDGSNQRRVTHDKGRDLYPDFSPDGKRLTFTSDRSGNQDIYVADFDGKDLSHLTDLTEKVQTKDGKPADDAVSVWSPAGDKLLFVSDRDGNNELYLMNPDGSGVANLTHHPKNDFGGTWSYDGTQIAFTSDRDSDANEIYIMNRDGSGVHRMTSDAASKFWPVFSRDGKRLLYSGRADEKAKEGYDLFVLNLDGKRLQITANAFDNSEGDW